MRHTFHAQSGSWHVYFSHTSCEPQLNLEGLLKSLKSMSHNPDFPDSLKDVLDFSIDISLISFILSICLVLGLPKLLPYTSGNGELLKRLTFQSLTFSRNAAAVKDFVVVVVCFVCFYNDHATTALQGNYRELFQRTTRQIPKNNNILRVRFWRRPSLFCLLSWLLRCWFSPGLSTVCFQGSWGSHRGERYGPNLKLTLLTKNQPLSWINSSWMAVGITSFQSSEKVDCGIFPGFLLLFIELRILKEKILHLLILLVLHAILGLLEEDIFGALANWNLIHIVSRIKRIIF